MFHNSILQTSVAGIFSLELRSGLGFVVELQFWDAVSVTEAPPLPGGNCIGLQCGSATNTRVQ